MNTSIATMSRKDAIETARSFIHSFTDRLVNHASKEYGVDSSLLYPIIRITSAESTRCSRGGVKGNKPWMSICVKNVLCGIMTPNKARQNVFHFDEYAHIVNDKDIGQLFHCDWQRYLAALVAHEFAHVIQHWSVTKNTIASMYAIDAKVISKAHGKVWQKIYRDFRINFVNEDAFKKIAVKAVDNNKPVKVMNRSWTVNSTQVAGGRKLQYFIDGVSVGFLFHRTGQFVQSWDVATNSWVKTTYTTSVEARRGLFGI